MVDSPLRASINAIDPRIRAYVDSDTAPDPLDPTSKSAKTWSEDSRAFAESAEDAADRADSAVNLSGSYLTLANATSAIADYTEGKSVEVTNDNANNGRYTKRSNAWVRTGDTFSVLQDTVDDIEADFDGYFPPTPVDIGINNDNIIAITTTDAPLAADPSHDGYVTGTELANGKIRIDLDYRSLDSVVESIDADDPGCSWKEVSDTPAGYHDPSHDGYVLEAINDGLMINYDIIEEVDEGAVSGLTTPVKREVNVGGSFITDDGRPYWIIGDAIHSYWMNGHHEYRNNFVLGFTSGIPFQANADSDFYGRLKLAQMTYGSSGFKVLTLGNDEGNTGSKGCDDHNRAKPLPFNPIEGFGGSYGLVVTHSFHNGRPKYKWISNSWDIEDLGTRHQMNPTTGDVGNDYGYGQGFLDYDFKTNNTIWEFCRNDAGGYRWGLNISTDGGLTFGRFQELFKRTGSNIYIEVVPKQNGDYKVILYVNPSTPGTSNNARRMLMLDVCRNGDIVSKNPANPGVIANFMADGFVAIDPWNETGKLGYVIYTSPTGTPQKRIRLSGAGRWADDQYAVTFVEGHDGLILDALYNAYAYMLFVDDRTSTPVVGNKITLCPAGYSMNFFEVEPAPNSSSPEQLPRMYNPDYIGGAEVVTQTIMERTDSISLDYTTAPTYAQVVHHLALVCSINRDGDGKSYTTLYEVDPVAETVIGSRVIKETTAPTMMARPEITLKQYYDGTHITYGIGTLGYFFYGRYWNFSFHKSDEFLFFVKDWLPEIT